MENIHEENLRLRQSLSLAEEEIKNQQEELQALSYRSRLLDSKVKNLTARIQMLSDKKPEECETGITRGTAIQPASQPQSPPNFSINPPITQISTQVPKFRRAMKEDKSNKSRLNLKFKNPSQYLLVCLYKNTYKKSLMYFLNKPYGGNFIILDRIYCIRRSPPCMTRRYPRTGLVPVGAGPVKALEHRLHGLPQVRDEVRATSIDPLLGITLMRKRHRGQQSMVNQLPINHRLETPEHPISMTKRRRSIGHVAPEHPLDGRRCSTSFTAPDHLFRARKRRRSTPDYPFPGSWRMNSKQDNEIHFPMPWEGENITVFLITADGKQITASLCQFSTICDLRKICLRKDPTIQTSAILYGTKTMRDDMRLYDYNIGNGSTIFSLTRINGGMPRKYDSTNPTKLKPQQEQHLRHNTEEEREFNLSILS